MKQESDKGEKIAENKSESDNWEAIKSTDLPQDASFTSLFGLVLDSPDC